jgi:hypothetical protein
MYPPRKNENKFIYGKLIELSLINMFQKVGYNCIDLDAQTFNGSEYKNDITLLGVDISIKAKKNKGGNIILINKLHKENSHHNSGDNININMIVCVIEEECLYLIPGDIVAMDGHTKETPGGISTPPKMITYMRKNKPEYMFKFPRLRECETKTIDGICAVNIMSRLYLTTIKEDNQYDITLSIR